MLEELQSQYQVSTFTAMLKARNFRSYAFLTRLGFSIASAEQVEEASPEANEIVMYKAAGPVMLFSL